MLKSYSAGYCGNQHHSYHGTTVQIMQPNSDCQILHYNEEPIPTSIASIEQQHSLKTLEQTQHLFIVLKEPFRNHQTDHHIKLGKMAQKTAHSSSEEFNINSFKRIYYHSQHTGITEITDFEEKLMNKTH